MVTERVDTGKSFPPLPARDIRKENSILPAINLQMEQMNKQLTQLIGHLQQLNHQIPIFQDKENPIHFLDQSKIAMEKNIDNRDYLTSKQKSTEVVLSRRGRRKRFSKYINGFFVFFLVIGIAAALFAAIVLLFYGPTMMSALRDIQLPS